ncbi:MAG TPA: hypothetical protein VFE40_03470 [Jatrophihabitantaceae bacterium]|jgi:hypothetical protein|nr:hypothetical protein [Jatrophihabitantaceae bacterium]
MPEPHPSLRALLAEDPPASVSALPPDVQQQLADAIADARRRQSADLQRSFEATLRHVPFALRGLVKRVVL